jgi:PAS domain-containing protein
MYKGFKKIEERIERLKEVFREFTGYEPVKVIGIGKDEIFFRLEGIYQEFMNDRIIEIRISEVNNQKNESFYIYEEDGFLQIEQIVKFDGVTYIILFEMRK